MDTIRSTVALPLHVFDTVNEMAQREKVSLNKMLLILILEAIRHRRMEEEAQAV